MNAGPWGMSNGHFGPSHQVLQESFHVSFHVHVETRRLLVSLQDCWDCGILGLTSNHWSSVGHSVGEKPRPQGVLCPCDLDGFFFFISMSHKQCEGPQASPDGFVSYKHVT